MLTYFYNIYNKEPLYLSFYCKIALTLVKTSKRKEYCTECKKYLYSYFYFYLADVP